MRFSISVVIALMLLFSASAAVLAHGTNGVEGDHHARVGELSYMEGKFDKIGQEQGPYDVLFSAVRLEDGAPILSMKSRSQDGSYKFAMQFFDGAEHEVTISLVNPATKAVIAEKKVTMEVEGFHPPASVKAKTMAFLILVIAAGMAVGVGLARLGKANQQWKGGHSHVS